MIICKYMKLNSRWNLVISVLKLFAKLKKIKGIYLTATFFVVLVYSYGYIQFSSVQPLSRVWLLANPWIAAHQASLSINNSRSSPKLMSIESVMPSNHLILWHPVLSCLQSFPETGNFLMSQFLASGGQSVGVSVSTSGLPMNIQDWSPTYFQ